jgi:hypothetical protein
MRPITPEERLIESVLDVKRRFTAEIDRLVLEYRAARPARHMRPPGVVLYDPRDEQFHQVRAAKKNVRKMRGG